jgi:hypothetical protein
MAAGVFYVIAMAALTCTPEVADYLYPRMLELASSSNVFRLPQSAFAIARNR